MTDNKLVELEFENIDAKHMGLIKKCSLSNKFNCLINRLDRSTLLLAPDLQAFASPICHCVCFVKGSVGQAHITHIFTVAVFVNCELRVATCIRFGVASNARQHLISCRDQQMYTSTT